MGRKASLGSSYFSAVIDDFACKCFPEYVRECSE